MMKKLLQRFKYSYRYALLHFLGTLFIAILLGGLVFLVWYPQPYRVMTGGLELYQLILVVDIICGPLLTLLLVTPTKSRKEVIIDMVLICTIQLSALGYGLMTVFEARPVAMVFEYNRFRLITHSEIYKPDLKKAKPPYNQIPLFDIQTVALRKATEAERDANLTLFLSTGVDLDMRPSYWMPYQNAKDEVLSTALPLDNLKGLTEAEKMRLEEAVEEEQINRKDLQYIPVIAPMSDHWIALISSQGDVIRYVNINGW